jgi:hypothetical protein
MVVTLVLAACDAGGSNEQADGVAATASSETTSTTTGAPTEAPTYRVVLDVNYHETLRYPGSGHILRDLELTYSVDEPVAAGEAVDAAASGTTNWTIRCYPGDAIADPAATATSEERGTLPLAPASTIELLPDQAASNPDVDWLAGPGIVAIEAADELWIGHRLPSSATLDQAVITECGDPVLALVVAWGHAAMTAPARVNIGGTDYSRAEALNRESDPPVYVLDPAGDGWLLTVVPLDELAAGPIEINYLREEVEAEGERRLVVTGTVDLSGR